MEPTRRVLRRPSTITPQQTSTPAHAAPTPQKTTQQSTPPTAPKELSWVEAELARQAAAKEEIRRNAWAEPTPELEAPKTPQETPEKSTQKSDESEKAPAPPRNRRTTQNPKSADRLSPREIQIRKARVVSNSLSRKKRASALNRGELFLTPADVLALQTMIGIGGGYMTIQQLANALSRSKTTITGRLALLAKAGLVEHESKGAFLGKTIIYRVTARAHRLVGMPLDTWPQRNLTQSHWDHSAGLAWLAGQEASFGGVWLSEREASLAGLHGVMSPRVLHKHPWTANIPAEAMKTWLPRYTPFNSEQEVVKFPDGLILKTKDGRLQPPTCVELELSTKTGGAPAYTKLLAPCERAIEQAHISPEIIYFVSPASRQYNEIQKAITDGVAARGGALACPIRLKLVNIPPTSWKPLIASHGW